MTAPQSVQLPALRVGQGYDIHQLVEGRPLIIGGVTIAHAKGLLGHSDADVLLHALTDALFGAAGLGDIGRHFPDTDAAFKGADSRVLLREAMRRVAERGFSICNIDATVIAQAPKLASYLPAMIELIAADLAIDATRINLKAKTAESLGALGRQEGIAAQAVVLLAGP
jgi:2-C-methyl-D-erythritol 2,4-cyclodiphosphate synthase